MSKKIISMVALFSIFAGVVSASGINGDYKGNAIVKVKVNGNYVNSDVPGINLDGTTMLPLRAISEALGAEVSWDQNTYTASLQTENSSVNVDKIAKRLKGNATMVQYSTDADGFTQLSFNVPYDIALIENTERFKEIYTIGALSGVEQLRVYDSSPYITFMKTKDVIDFITKKISPSEMTSKLEIVPKN